MQYLKVFLALFLVGVAISENISDDQCQNGILKEKKCSDACKLPDCACSGTEPEPNVADRPQIVYLTFDDGMTKLFDENYYSELFMEDANGNYKYTNPNGCPIKATFFVSALSNDFQVVRIKVHLKFLYWPIFRTIVCSDMCSLNSKAK